VLLKEGGFRRQIAGFNVERLGNTTRALALGEYCFRQARAHAETRMQFGRPLMEFQGLQWKFAEMRVALDAAQLLLWRAAVSAGTGCRTRSRSPSRNTPATRPAGWRRTRRCR
jgi:alkylation response protein AidB-like acyl-CoA dehydrogenase